MEKLIKKQERRSLEELVRFFSSDSKAAGKAGSGLTDPQPRIVSMKSFPSTVKDFT